MRQVAACRRDSGNGSTDMSKVRYDNAAGNCYDKYGSRNPIVRWIMRGFLEAFERLVLSSGAKKAHEIGCGEGHLSLLLAQRGLIVRGSDVSDEIVRVARSRAYEAGMTVPFEVKSLYDLRAPTDAADLIVCCEVLEHLPDPNHALTILAALAQPYLIVSVPREPLWRMLNLCRLHYLTDLGNTPGHIQHWSSRAFLQFLQQRFDALAVELPLPWTMALCRVRATRGPIKHLPAEPGAFFGSADEAPPEGVPHAATRHEGVSPTLAQRE